MDLTPKDFLNLGVGAAVAFYLLRFTIPTMWAGFRAELKEERDQNTKHVEAIVARLDQHSAALTAVLGRLDKIEGRMPVPSCPSPIDVKAGDTVPGILRASLPADKSPEHE
jgi:hypothetical protein